MNITFSRCRDTSDALMDAAMALYRASFPSHELRLWADQKAVMSDPAYHFDMCLTDGRTCGTHPVLGLRFLHLCRAFLRRAEPARSGTRHADSACACSAE